MKHILSGAAVVTAAVGAIMSAHIATAGAQVGDGNGNAFAANTYSAIALSLETGYYGWVPNSNSYEQAASMAIADCQTRGGTDCEVKIAWRNGCGAIAVNKADRMISYGTGPSLSAATTDALGKQSGTGTEIAHWNCTPGYSL